MAVKTFIIISPTFIQGRHAPVDTLIDLDDNIADHVELLGALRDALRIKAFDDLTEAELAAYQERYAANPENKATKEEAKSPTPPVGFRLPPAKKGPSAAAEPEEEDNDRPAKKGK
jgi:hypothetical protein